MSTERRALELVREEIERLPEHKQDEIEQLAAQFRLKLRASGLLGRIALQLVACEIVAEVEAV